MKQTGKTRRLLMAATVLVMVLTMVFAGIFQTQAAQIRGDMNENGELDTNDAIYMLRHCFMPVAYPIDQDGDLNGDNVVSSVDAIYLLRHIFMPDSYPLHIAVRELEYTLSEDGTYYIVTGTGTHIDADLVIPETYNDIPVKEIAADAFKDDTNLVSVVIGENIEKIGEFAFNNVEKLTKVAIENENIEFEDKFFIYNCNNLERIEFAGTASEWEELKIYIPGDVKVIYGTNHRHEIIEHLGETCTESGYNVYYCDCCDDMYTETIPATGHDIQNGETVLPTCTQDGLISGTCSTCGITTEIIVDSPGHQESEFIFTGEYCGENPVGYTECEICGVIVNEIGHRIETHVKHPTCTTDGYVSQNCTKCGLSEVKVTEAFGHAEGETIVFTQATCTQEGIEHTLCKWCGEVIHEDIIPLKNHLVSSVDGDGICTYKCINCDFEQVVETANKYVYTLITGNDNNLLPLYVEKGTVPVLPVPEWNDYTFEGWYYDRELRNIYIDTPATADIVLYANWSTREFNYSHVNEHIVSGDTDITFTIETEIELTDRNINEYVKADSGDENVNLFIESKDGNKYVISGDFDNAKIYNITVSDGITANGSDNILICVGQKDKINLQMHNDVKKINVDDICGFYEQENKYYFLLEKDTFNRGDACIIYDGSYDNILCSVEITSEGRSGQYYVYECLSADLDRIFEEYSIYFVNREVDLSNLVFVDQLEQTIMSQVRTSALCYEFEEAARQYAMIKSSGSSTYTIKFKKLTFPDPVLTVENNKVNIDIKIVAEFEMVNNNTYKVKDVFYLTARFDAQIGFNLSVDARLRQLLKGNLTAVLDTTINSDLSFTFSTNVSQKKEEIKLFQNIILSVKKNGDAKKVEAVMGEHEKEIYLGSAQVVFYGIVLGLDFNVVLSFGVTGEFTAGVGYSTTKQLGVIMRDFKLQEIQNDSATVHLYAYMAGIVKTGVAFKMDAYLSVLGCVGIGIDFSIGLSAEAGGMFVFSWNVGTAADWSFAGYFELDLNFKSNVKAFIRLLRKEYELKLEILNASVPLLTVGDKIMPFDFVIEGEDKDFSHDYNKKLSMDTIVDTQVYVQDLSKITEHVEVVECEYYLVSSTGPVSITVDGILVFNEINAESTDIVLKVVYKNLYKIVELTVVNSHEHEYVQSVYSEGCLEDTVHRYRCRTCRYYYDVLIMEAPGHSFGEWIGKPETTCTKFGYYYRTCRECGERETRYEKEYGHDYVDHFCIRCNQCDHADKIMNVDDMYLYKKATCFSQAEYKYSCLYCGIAYEEYFKYGDLLPHTYGDEFTCHDRECLYPGCTHVDKTTTEHVYSDWIEEEISLCTGIPYRTRACIDCRYTDIDAADSSIAPHNYEYVEGLSPTCSEAGYTDYFVCTECGQVDCKEVLPPLGHTFGQYIYNDEEHYRLCIHGCETTEGAEEHVYTDCCDPTCNVCGCLRKAEHEYSDEYSYNSIYHWKVCIKCNKGGGYTEHTGGFATCTDKPVCNVCSHEYSCKTGHLFSAKVPTEEYLKQEATCTEAAVYYYSCTHCGETSTRTFLFGEALGHIQSDTMLCDSVSHWYTCLRDGCDAKLDREIHYGGHATCANRAVCRVCASEYGRLSEEHIPEYTATCEHKAKCMLCGDEYGSLLDHSGGEATCLSKAICDMCGGEYGEYAQHTGGIATCMQRACCDICGEEYGSLAAHKYNVELADDKYFCRSATCLAPAKYYYSCECSAIGMKTFNYGQPLGHVWSDEYAHDDSCHWLYCTRENCTEKLRYEEHSGGVGTCTERGSCVVCNVEYTKYKSHNYTKKVVDDEYLVHEATCTQRAEYYYLCSGCDKVSDEETYYVGDWLGHIPGNEIYSDEKNHWHVCTREGCGDKINISSHSGGVSTCTQRAVCEECGAEYGSSGHEFTQRNTSEEYCITLPDCTHDGKYYFSCKCGEAGTATFTVKAEGHVIDDLYYSDDDFHWQVCTVCLEVIDKEEHHGGYATCMSAAVCEVCNKEYGESGHVMNCERISAEYLATPATCEEDATYYYSCRYGCGAKSDRIFVDKGSRLGHKTELVYDETSHWYECSRDGCTYVHDYEAHTEKEPATCTHKAVCSVCGIEFGELKEHIYSEKVMTPEYCVTAETCTQMGEYFFSCECGHAGTATFFVAATGHIIEDEESYQYDDTSHWQVCSVCDLVIGKADHSGGVASCTTAGQCGVCRVKYIDATGHSYDTEYTCDSDSHYYKCLNEGCNSRKSEQKHYIDTNDMSSVANCLHGNICAACGLEYTPKLSTHNYGDYEYNDSEHWKICKDCGLESRAAHTPEVKATCINRAVCGDCGQEYGEMLPHVEDTDKWLQVNDSGAYYHYHACKTPGCSYIFSQGNHTFSEWVMTVEPECVNEGKYERYCTVCNLTEEKVIPATGHAAYLEPEEKLLSNGYLSIIIYEKCYDCDHKEQYSDEALIHVHNNPVRIEAVKPTCTESGLTSGLKCGYCDEVLCPQTVVPPLGHKFVDNVCIRCESGASAGLEYTLSEDGTHYIVSEGTCTDSDIIIPANHDGLPVWIIGDNAFADYMDITSVSIPEGIRIIGNDAFAGCSSLTSVYIPSTVTSIGLGAFTWCAGLEEIIVHSGNAEYFSVGNCLINDNLLILGCKNSVIPVDGSVTMIGDYAFADCSELEAIMIPDSVNTISDWAFCYSGLISITIPEFVEYIGSGAFMGCSQLSDIEFNGQEKLTEIGDYAFADCVSLQYDVFLPSGVEKIGIGIFSGCTLLENISLPLKVTVISDNAFYNCSSLRSVLLHDNIVSVGSSAFAGCTSLESISLCDAVSEIGSSAFARCESLTDFTVPSGVSVVREGVFSRCINLKTVSLPGGLKEIEAQAFSYCSSLSMIYFNTTSSEAWGNVVKGENWDKECGDYEVSIMSTQNPAYAVPETYVKYNSFDTFNGVEFNAEDSKNILYVTSVTQVYFYGWVASTKEITGFAYTIDSSAFVTDEMTLIDIEQSAIDMAASMGCDYANRYKYAINMTNTNNRIELFAVFSDGSVEMFHICYVRVPKS